MTTYLAISQTGSDAIDIRSITAADRPSAAAVVKQQLGMGLSINAGQRPQIQVALIEVAGFGTLTPNADGTQATLALTNQAQPAIADLPASNPTTLAQVITAMGVLASKQEQVLAALRAAGILLP